MENDKRIKPITVHKPNPFLYYPIAFFVKVLSKILFRVCVDKKGLKGEKGPFVIIGNHSSVMDIVFVASCVFPRRVNVVAGRDLFTWKVLQPFLRPMGVIPKSQFGLDLVAIRMMCDAIKKGCNIVIYPEGKTSLDGTNLHYLPPSIGKFLKLTDATVVCANTLGAYLTKPRFQHGFNYGKVKVHLNKIIGREELQTMSPKAVYDRVSAAISFNDNIYQQREAVKFRSKAPARQMEYILYKCPKCGVEYKMRTTDFDIICDACGNTVRYDQYGVLTPKGDVKAFNRLDLWYQWERDNVRQELQDGGNDYKFEKAVTLYNFDPKTNKYQANGNGVLCVTMNTIEYHGTREEVACDVVEDTREIHTITTKNEEGIDLVVNGEIWRFLFDEHKYSTKFSLVVEESFKLKKNIQ